MCYASEWVCNISVINSDVQPTTESIQNGSINAWVYNCHYIGKMTETDAMLDIAPPEIFSYLVWFGIFVTVVAIIILYIQISRQPHDKK